jgi:hypothetical protein
VPSFGEFVAKGRRCRGPPDVGGILRPLVIASSAIRITTSTKRLAADKTSGGLSFEESIAEQAYSAQLVSRGEASAGTSSIPIVFVQVSDPVGQGRDELRQTVQHYRRLRQPEFFDFGQVATDAQGGCAGNQAGRPR